MKTILLGIMDSNRKKGQVSSGSKSRKTDSKTKKIIDDLKEIKQSESSFKSDSQISFQSNQKYRLE